MPEGGSGGSATGNPFLDLAIVVVLIVVSGFFAAAELSLITARRHRLSQLASEGNRSAQVAQGLIEDPSRFLATIQVALTFLGFLASAVGAVSFSGSLADLIRLIPLQFLRDAASTITWGCWAPSLQTEWTWRSARPGSGAAPRRARASVLRSAPRGCAGAWSSIRVQLYAARVNAVPCSL